MESSVEVLAATETAQMEKEYVLHPWSSQSGYKPFITTKAQGCYVIPPVANQQRALLAKMLANRWGQLRDG